MENKDKLLNTPVCQILKSLAGDFVSVQYFNIDDDTYCNLSTSPKFEKFLEGITSIREAFAKNVEVIIKPEDREEASKFYDIDTLSERMGDKKSISYEYEGALRGWCVGSFIPVIRHEDGTIETALYTVKYIDENRAKEKNQQNVIDALSRGFLNVYAANASKNIARVVKLNGYVTKGVNFEEGRELDYSELIHAYANARVYEKDRVRFIKSVAPEYVESHLKDNDEYSFPYRIMADDGSIHYYQGKVVKTEDPGWNVFAFQNIDELVTEEKQRADELQNALDQAERANRSKTDFLSRMSHDIRTPINGIVGMMHIMESEIDSKEKILDSIGKVKKLSRQLELLINDVLEMTRIESGRITLAHELINLPEILHETNPAVATLADNNNIMLAGAHYNIEHENVIASPSHIQRIVMNIMTNGIKYNKVGGSMECWLNEIPIDKAHSTYEFIVADTGIGMSQEFLGHVYEPFSRENSTVHNPRRGTGLGMAITKELVDLMGGTIDIKSTLGEGTTVTIRIPLEISDNTNSNDGEDTVISLGGKKILVVEDNDLNFEIAKYILEEEGAIVDYAGNGQEAVESFEKSTPGQYDLILMDIMMPVMNGLDATVAIRKLDREDAKTIPIVAMTANAFQEDVERCISVGMNAHISKPINIENMNKKIARYIK